MWGADCGLGFEYACLMPATERQHAGAMIVLTASERLKTIRNLHNGQPVRTQPCGMRKTGQSRFRRIVRDEFEDRVAASATAFAKNQRFQHKTRRYV